MRIAKLNRRKRLADLWWTRKRIRMGQLVMVVLLTVFSHAMNLIKKWQSKNDSRN